MAAMARPPSGALSATAATLAAVASLGSARTATAEPPAHEVMARLAAYAARLDSMRTHASYRFDGELSTFDRHGDADSLKAMRGRVDADGTITHMTVLRYTEDGEDKTSEAQKKALDSEKRKKDTDRPRFRLPILADQQPRYVFDQIATDPSDPSRVKISFVPKNPAADTIEGSAWVDTRSGCLLSAGFKLSKPSTFVDYVHVSVEFGGTTSLGTAISNVEVDGQSGFLFFHKRFHGEARVYDYTIIP
jgi:hypothetical protein